MILNLINTNQKGKSSRLAFGEELAALGEKIPDVVVLEADLSKSTRTDLFAAKYPDRFFNMGIAEANMIGVAAGFARAGKIPFAASFGCFLTGRFDQIRMSVAFTGANVRLVGTHAGVAIGEDGHSQMALEDLTMMRSLPNMTVLQPGDEEETKALVKWSAEKHNGPVYFRLTRQDLAPIKRASPYVVKVGKWEPLTELKAGAVVIVATGGVLENSILAAQQISPSNPSVCVVNAAWIQPYDAEFLDLCLKTKVKAIVTVEDHYTKGGLGGLVAEHISARGGAPALLRIGVEEFGQSASPIKNYELYGLNPQGISSKILKFLDKVSSV